MRTHPNVRHMAALFDFPPPYCALPRESTRVEDLEFSDIGREPVGWPTVAIIVASIAVPFGLVALAIARGWITPWWTMVHHL